MGWTSYCAEFYKNGIIDRKKEMNQYYTQKEDGKYPEMNVLKSSMVGSVYYAAVEVKRNGVVEKVFPAIVSTSINMGDYYNFSFKDVGLCYYDCPKGILDLLTETDDEYELQWREKCKKRAEMKREKTALPVGTIIKFRRHGNEITLEKMKPAHRFKRPWWYCAENNTYFPVTHIPDEYEIIKKGA